MPRRILCSCVLLAVSVVGCAGAGKTPGQERVHVLSRNLETCIEALAKLDAELEKTLTAHAEIVRNTDGDYFSHFETFDRGLKDVEKYRQLTQTRYEATTSSADQYFATWSGTTDQFSSDEMRQRSKQRLETMQEEFGDIWEGAEDAKAEYEELISLLEDQRLYWSSSLNASTAEEMEKYSSEVASLSRALFGKIEAATQAAREFHEEVAQRIQLENAAAERGG